MNEKPPNAPTMKTSFAPTSQSVPLHPTSPLSLAFLLLSSPSPPLPPQSLLNPLVICSFFASIRLRRSFLYVLFSIGFLSHCSPSIAKLTRQKTAIMGYTELDKKAINTIRTLAVGSFLSFMSDHDASHAIR